ncbi:MAG: nucleoside-diphosphate sugar epimerase/dehydratase [Parabacteroides sp.]|nr:nucleoside-diphosphate sugar epimerase/dehydratase [Parabacteroides sp.]
MRKNFLRMSYLNPYIIWGADCILSFLCSLLSFLFYHYLINVSVDVELLHHFLWVALIASFVWTGVCKTFRGIIRYSTMVELTRVIYAMMLKALTFTVAAYIVLDYVGLFAYSVIITDFIGSVFLLMSVRVFIVNFYYHLLWLLKKPKQVTLIYGVTEGAINLANHLRNGNGSYDVIGFVTRQAENKKLRVAGYTIYLIDEKGGLQKLFSTLKVDCVLFLSTTDLHGDEEIVQYGLEHNINLRVLPFLTGQEQWTDIQLRNIQIEDLLSREEINIDLENIRHELAGKVILVTGAAGSIGSELCRQLCRFELKQLVLFDFSETATYAIDMELRKKFPGCNVVPVIGDVRNRDRVESQIKCYRPDIIFHAAAYKHVPMMEKFPCEAVRTNVLGTRIVADMALKYDVKKFIMISTDKAVHPSSVMGATKRLAEMYVQSLGSAIKEGILPGKTAFVTTRFGNVLGSNGSVIPLFRQQIMEGGPVTVTHPDIIRYFMTIPEACRLVLEAAFMGQGNEIFIFDMGKPVKIADMARRMIKLAGLQPDKDIQIAYIGLRPGEKLYEELLYNKENATPTANPKIFRGISIERDYAKVESALRRLVEVAHTDNKEETVALLKQIVPEFKSVNSVYEALDKANETAKNE